MVFVVVGIVVVNAVVLLVDGWGEIEGGEGDEGGSSSSEMMAWFRHRGLGLSELGVPRDGRSWWLWWRLPW